MFYLTKTPGILKAVYKSCIWNMPPSGNKVYLTFDDGPHPQATPFVLEQLARYQAKATFFCIGKNVVEHPGIYQQILEAGHAVGNHTHNHLNGWKTGTEKYIENVLEAGKYISSTLFRPPYGRITPFQIRQLKDKIPGVKIIMWDLLSGDFDTGINGEACVQNVVFKLAPGSIVVFHDSTKAWDRMEYALPRILEFCKKKGLEPAALQF
ncbi:Peptidoglycan/xylan/chitin deacetylase, PgdA/CDA1 family [Chitinophaga terrae (ex Kim and Jung 2007)]|uniref:Peptidoglycan/xylan/chitin deacetylase, PgdA/CDA1 family n=1 Tax=Chitinophaga terrae (ex Kim and Jung 2007) TaxID=408074 RepID=A0A1H4CR86_9BACT|nr:polysaccharide deacetylase family protein [Chitinophaga terrae (ex Kim and Jung 2007)]GEP90406.1 polysaccharide deacetylase [Chitinophaga terrae (ex Kim and Jung 2007)]SEA62925.1 Peptidoglycan/xylan/chitin deacetylase, PgdA/CDA1 family [Chitinophaga terrae (ex Kim and Jung 2007)]